jgi:predicted porin
VDVDETNANDGTSGVYFNITAGHSIPFNNDVFTGLDLSGSFAFANSGFTEFYYGGLSDGGPHDVTFTVGLPISIDDNWSAGAFVTYSGLLGESIRASQFGDPRVPSKPGGATYADTIWGGLSLSLSF